MAAADEAAIEQAVADLRGVLDSEDAEAIKAKTEALAQASMKLGEAMYKAQAAGRGCGRGGGRRRRRRKDEGVVDAEFEEVDDEQEALGLSRLRRASRELRP